MQKHKKHHVLCHGNTEPSMYGYDFKSLRNESIRND